ncbi:MAG: hypothetical protein PF487_04450 [Bacteroidales bacterium]|jgi:hypothetical protein|nr:hypothetical protein [Bacteroidales bacterium]
MFIKIEIENCSGCPLFKSSPYPTFDSWERAEYWWCQADDAIAPNEGAEELRLFIKKASKLPKLRYIAGYVEWKDRTPIPEWCPCKFEE